MYAIKYASVAESSQMENNAHLQRVKTLTAWQIGLVDENLHCDSTEGI